jgi:hypothetical protein
MHFDIARLKRACERGRAAEEIKLIETRRVGLNHGQRKRNLRPLELWRFAVSGHRGVRKPICPEAAIVNDIAACASFIVGSLAGRADRQRIGEAQSIWYTDLSAFNKLVRDQNVPAVK